jgi:hypothetical protein
MEEFRAAADVYLHGAHETPDGAQIVQAFREHMLDYSSELIKRVCADGYGENEERPISAPGAPGFSVVYAVMIANSYYIREGVASPSGNQIACALCGCNLSGSKGGRGSKKHVFMVLDTKFADGNECDVRVGIYLCEYHGRFLQTVHAAVHFDQALALHIARARAQLPNPTFEALVGPVHSATNKDGKLKKAFLKWKPSASEMANGTPKIVQTMSDYRAILEKLFKLIGLPRGGTESENKRRKLDAVATAAGEGNGHDEQEEDDDDNE